MFQMGVGRAAAYSAISLSVLFNPVVAWAESQSEPSYVESRLEMEKEAEENRFAILPHKPNYFLLSTYNSRPNQDPWKGLGAGETPIKKVEIKFQISIKIPLTHDLFMEGDGLYAGYTQKSFWQAYSKEISSPFRENNFNPEIFYRMKLDEEVLGLNARILTLGFEHESNGRAEPLSRSWNRIYGIVVAEKSNLTLALKAWYRIPEKASEDNNPDITTYLGYGELYAYYKYDSHTLGMMFRPAFSGGFKPGLQLDWSFPLFKNLQGYVQYYNGYGESLIDYNHYSNRIGVGIMLNNWL
jgi:phospholipase A1